MFGNHLTHRNHHHGDHSTPRNIREQILSLVFVLYVISIFLTILTTHLLSLIILHILSVILLLVLILILKLPGTYLHLLHSWLASCLLQIRRIIFSLIIIGVSCHSSCIREGWLTILLCIWLAIVNKGRPRGFH